MEQMLYHYLSHIHGNPLVHGKVLNVGLGEGHAARLFLYMRPVSSLVTIEWDPDVVAAYRAAHQDALESAHTIRLEDAATTRLSGVFDFVYVDILNAMDEANFSDLRGFLARAKNLMGPGSTLLLEFLSDTPLERELRRQWLPANFTQRITRTELSRVGTGRAQEMVYWTKT